MNKAAAASLIITMLCGAARAEPPLYTVAKTIPLGGGERWDYATFDADSGRVYVAHGDHVTVVDPAKGTVVGEIAGLPGGTHGIGISTANGLGFTDDGKAGTIAAFDLKTLKIVKRLDGAPDADGIVVDPATGRVFVVNGDSGSITAVDPKTDTVIKTIAVGAGLEAAVADGKGKLFVDGVEAHDIVAIDTRAMTVLAHYPMPGCERPHGIAMDTEARRIFATCVNKAMAVVDADTGKAVATLAIGTGSDGAAFDPKRKRALSSNGDGTLTVVREKDAATFAVEADVATARGGRTVAIDPATGRVFIPAADVEKVDPPAAPGGRPRVTYVSGSLKLLVLEPRP
ncbi:MAG: YncE family protein [Alphaproteobacteria bacterium]|nr:YncE family protein [Alphaproteobacteria bacterium]